MPREKDAWIEDVPGVLRAMDASTLEELWNNSKEPQYKFAKYCPPTVANGRVYLATFSGIIAVYGPKR
jgi:outer membrane protein assembly factor BamB